MNDVIGLTVIYFAYVVAQKTRAEADVLARVARGNQSAIFHPDVLHAAAFKLDFRSRVGQLAGRDRETPDPMPIHDTVIIPSEIQSREFDGKLLLACFLAERGLSSIVGSRNHIHMAIARLPRSVYIGKDVRFSSDRISGILKRLGHTIVALDEEAQFYYSRESYRKLRVSRQALQAADALLAWGPDNALAWRESEHYTGAPIFETGNPRIDLMRPELRGLYTEAVKALRDRFGRFVLINTNFGGLNHFFPNLTILKPPERGMEEEDRWKAGLAAHRYPIFRAFLDMLPKLTARFPELQFVLRPHPAENHDTWRKAAGGAANMHVLHEGSIVPWILASEAVIHNGCTTGLEAYVLGGRPIAYQPRTSGDYDLRLPNELSHQVLGLDQAYSEIEKILNGDWAQAGQDARRKALFDQHVTSSPNRLACEEIADVVVQAADGGLATSKPALAQRLSGTVAAEARAVWKRWAANKPGHKSNEAYTRHRFPGLGVSEVRAKIALFSRTLGRFSTVDAEDASENIFKIHAIARAPRQ
jgi:surface carbohydrate biosynthesis protein